MITYFELLKMIYCGILPKFVEYNSSRYDLYFFEKDNRFSYMIYGRDDLILRISNKCSDLMTLKCIKLPSNDEDFIHTDKKFEGSVKIL